MIDSTNPRQMANNIRALDASITPVVANPEGAATGSLNKIGIGGSIYALNSNVNYSTNEVDTGVKWTDGSTIYQKTVSLTLSSESTTEATLGVKIDKLIDLKVLSSIALGDDTVNFVGPWWGQGDIPVVRFAVRTASEVSYFRVDRTNESIADDLPITATVYYTKPAAAAVNSTRSRKK